MCDLVESGELDINTNLDRILNIMGEIADAVADGDEMATQVTVGRFARILVAIQNQVDQVKVQAAYSNLSEEAQNGINMLTTMV
jgi:L-serine deaminase